MTRWDGSRQNESREAIRPIPSHFFTPVPSPGVTGIRTTTQPVKLRVPSPGAGKR